jgi:muramoyltetrapeptide carboxypeptidase
VLLVNPLRKGDKVGIVSPSAAITRNLRPRLDRGMMVLRRLGFEVVLAKNALRVEDYSAGTPDERAEDINSMFANQEIKAIICSQGGATANSCLPLLEWNTIEKNPKIFLGMSDITVLLNAMFAKTSLVTFHGNDVIWGFARPTEYDLSEFLDRLVEGKTEKIRKSGPRKAVRRGVAEGKLLGGNVGVLLKLAGTPYWPDFTDAILFMEVYKITPEDCDYTFNQLKQMGVFDKIQGAIVGHIHGLQTARTKTMQMEDILLKVTSDYSFPILKTNDFGHNCPNTILPVGSTVRLNAEKRKSKSWKDTRINTISHVHNRYASQRVGCTEPEQIGKSQIRNLPRRIREINRKRLLALRSCIVIEEHKEEWLPVLWEGKGKLLDGFWLYTESLEP